MWQYYRANDWRYWCACAHANHQRTVSCRLRTSDTNPCSKWNPWSCNSRVDADVFIFWKWFWVIFDMEEMIKMVLIFSLLKKYDKNIVFFFFNSGNFCHSRIFRIACSQTIRRTDQRFYKFAFQTLFSRLLHVNSKSHIILYYYFL